MENIKVKAGTEITCNTSIQCYLNQCF